jgi:hypothetical protein
MTSLLFDADGRSKATSNSAEPSYKRRLIVVLTSTAGDVSLETNQIPLRLTPSIGSPENADSNEYLRITPRSPDEK